MRISSINTETLQSYFESICKSYYIAYMEIKRLEEKKEEYINKIYLEFGEQKVRKRLIEETLLCTDKEYQKLAEIEEFWNKRLKHVREEIRLMLEHVKDSSIIVKSKEEIIALIEFFYRNKVSKNKIINTDELIIKSFFPTGEKMYKEFLEAYCKDASREEGICVQSSMERVYATYF